MKKVRKEGNYMKKKQEFQYFKLNSDDILSIVKDDLARQVEMSNKAEFKEGHTAKLNFIEDENGLRIVAVFSGIDDSLKDVDLNEIDKEIDFNGYYSSSPKETNIEMTEEERKRMMKRLGRNAHIQKWSNFFRRK